MASRMERYYKSEKRSEKNENLYKQLGEFTSYTNIEGIVDISNSNEINIDKVKEMLENREKQNSSHLHQTLSEIPPLQDQLENEEIKTYDLKDVLDKAKTEHSEDDSKYRNLENKQYEMLKKIQLNHPEDEEINELLNTLALGSDNGDDLGIFDELKSNTMVGEPASIKKILNEAKETESIDKSIDIEQVHHTNLDNIDKSFYTASLNFSDKDFEDLRSLDNNIKVNNKLIKILIMVFSFLVAAILLIVIMKIIF